MNTIAVVLIIVFVLAIIASNIALIRYSNKFQLPPSDKDKDKDKDKEQQDKPDHDPKQQSQDDPKSPK
ncbi:MAG: DUF2897 family protein [Gammaproteobacteria bacterium]|nr:DUF2897 family protein [Gammaproteobacteria bacterium]